MGRSAFILFLALMGLLPFQNCGRTGFSGNGGGYEGTKTDPPPTTDYVNAGSSGCADQKAANRIRLNDGVFFQIRKDCVAMNAVVDPIVSHDKATPTLIVQDSKLYNQENAGQSNPAPGGGLAIGLFCRSNASNAELVEVQLSGGTAPQFTKAITLYRDVQGANQSLATDLNSNGAGGAQINYANADNSWLMSLDQQAMTASFSTSLLNFSPPQVYTASLTCFAP